VVSLLLMNSSTGATQIVGTPPAEAEVGAECQRQNIARRVEGGVPTSNQMRTGGGPWPPPVLIFWLALRPQIRVSVVTQGSRVECQQKNVALGGALSPPSPRFFVGTPPPDPGLHRCGGWSAHLSRGKTTSRAEMDDASSTKYTAVRSSFLSVLHMKVCPPFPHPTMLLKTCPSASNHLSSPSYSTNNPARGCFRYVESAMRILGGKPRPLTPPSLPLSAGFTQKMELPRRRGGNAQHAGDREEEGGDAALDELVKAMQTLVDQTAAKGKATIVLGNGKVVVRPSSSRPFALLEGKGALEYLQNPAVSNCILILRPGGRQMHACAGKVEAGRVD
jgi:hypothetical protein